MDHQGTVVSRRIAIKKAGRGRRQKPGSRRAPGFCIVVREEIELDTGGIRDATKIFWCGQDGKPTTCRRKGLPFMSTGQAARAATLIS